MHNSTNNVVRIRDMLLSAFLFLCFLVFPPANPSNFHIANVFVGLVSMLFWSDRQIEMLQLVGSMSS